MSLLWPERFVVGLFRGDCWIRSAKRNEVIDAVAGTEGQSWVMPAFEHAAKRIAELQRGGSRIDVVIGSNLSASMLLPWQDQQLSSPQLKAYAQACFNRVGAGVDAEWTIDAGFRYFSANGFAVAVPTVLLEGLISAARTYGMVLQNVTPVASMAYWRHAAPTRVRHGMLIIDEPDRLSLMSFEKGRATNFDTQPRADDVNMTLRRLLSRHPAPNSGVIHVWSADMDTTVPARLAQRCPGMKVRLLDIAGWRPR